MKKDTLQSINTIFCENVIKKMAFLGLTVKYLSYKADISHDTLKRLLTGTTINPSLHICLKIANALNCTVSELLNPSMEYFQEYSLLSENSKRLIRLMALCEYSACISQENTSDVFAITLFSMPECEAVKNSSWKISLFEKTKIALSCVKYKDCAFAIEVPDSRLHPVYFKGDILIISQCPFIGCANTAVFSYFDSFHIAKYDCCCENPFSPVNGSKSEFFSIDPKNALILGYVFDVLRYKPEKITKER